MGLGYWALGQTIGPFPPIYGAIVAVVSVLWVATSLLVTPNHVLAWKRGAVGEEETAKALAGLPSTFVVLHDRVIPGSRANIDHIVIGPPGIYVVETKRYTGKLTIRDGELFVAGRRQTKFIDQVHREAAAVSRVLADAGRVARRDSPTLRPSRRAPMASVEGRRRGDRVGSRSREAAYGRT